MRLFDLTGRVAIITGGNGGIGLGMATGLCEAGAHAVLVGRSGDKGRSAVASLAGRGWKASFIEADITDEAACRAVAAETEASLGGVDILINNAGIAIRKAPEDYTLDEWRTVMDTNLTSAFTMSQAVYASMKARGGGKIINIGSVLALFGAPFSVAYSSSKGGLVQFTKALATAWAPANIQVNAILPGWIDTDLTVAARAQVEGLEKNVIARVPAKRWGKVEDFAGAAIFLSSAASDFVTGATLLVDGGFAAQG